MEGGMSSIDVSIIIVSFNTKDLLRACLATLQEAKNWEIIVVDNASNDGSEKMVEQEFPKVKLIKNKQNRGFAAANNSGLKVARGRYLLLLNSDTEVPQGAIDEMKTFMDEHADVGVSTGRLILPNGKMDKASHRGFPTPWAALSYFVGLEKLFPRSKFFAQYHQGYKNLNEPHEIDSPSGAFYFLRREVYESVGPLDEDYFMYGEDLDWSYRIKLAGWKIYFYPKVTILHRKKQSGRSSADPVLQKKTRGYFYDTMKLFYKKHYAHRYSPLVTALIEVGIGLKSSL